MADFEADKTSGKGPTLVMVHPLKLNDTESDKRASLIVDVNGVTKTVNLIQKKGSLNYEYQLEVDKDTLNILGKGGTDTLVVTSRRREMINGTPQGEWENVEVTAEFLEEPPFTAGIRFTDAAEKTLEVNITSKNHTEQAITGTLTIKQSGSGNNKTIQVIQAAGTVSYNHRLEPPTVNLLVPKDQNANVYETSVGFTITGYRDKLIEGEKVSEEIMAFKIPTVGQSQAIKLFNSNVTVTYWITNYGNISNTPQATLSATVHARKTAGGMIGGVSANFECVFTDGGTHGFTPLLAAQIM
jgi:hypothetical protein|nr:MAG TPA: hypothetical protein [Caudoviricetes sp.]